MAAGRIEQVGPKLEVYHQPASRFVAGFVGAPNRLRVRLDEQNAAYSRLLWGGLDLFGLAVPAARVGDLVDLFIKPERIHLAPASPGVRPDLINRLRGTLRDVIFKGPYVDCLVELGSGQELTVSAGPETPGLERGAQVEIGWPAEAAAIFPAEAS